MVNVGFPPFRAYGFEMVDAGPKPGPASIENLRANRIGGNFRRIKLNAITCDLSRAVSHVPLRDRSQSTKGDDREREMFFLLRMAFWLGLVLVLLPREK